MYAFISYMHTVVLSFPTFISTAPSSNPFHMPQLHVKFVIMFKVIIIVTYTTYIYIHIHICTYIFKYILTKKKYEQVYPILVNNAPTKKHRILNVNLGVRHDYLLPVIDFGGPSVTWNHTGYYRLAFVCPPNLLESKPQLLKTPCYRNQRNQSCIDWESLSLSVSLHRVRRGYASCRWREDILFGVGPCMRWYQNAKNICPLTQ